MCLTIFSISWGERRFCHIILHLKATWRFLRGVFKTLVIFLIEFTNDVANFPDLFVSPLSLMTTRHFYGQGYVMPYYFLYLFVVMIYAILYYLRDIKALLFPYSIICSYNKLLFIPIYASNLSLHISQEGVVPLHFILAYSFMLIRYYHPPPLVWVGSKRMGRELEQVVRWKWLGARGDYYLLV